MNHTPTPYKIGYHAHDGIRIEVNGCSIANVWGKNNEANAEFIVRACNSHDELVGALEEINTIFDEEHRILTTISLERQKRLFRCVNLAIDKAKAVGK